jgi:hypothetical protein
MAIESAPSVTKAEERDKVAGYSFAFHSMKYKSGQSTSRTQKCRVLLHIGNSLSFFIDNAGGLPYDLRHQHSWDLGAVPPSLGQPVVTSEWLLPTRIRVLLTHG